MLMTLITQLLPSITESKHLNNHDHSNEEVRLTDLNSATNNYIYCTPNNDLKWILQYVFFSRNMLGLIRMLNNVLLGELRGLHIYTACKHDLGLL